MSIFRRGLGLFALVLSTFLFGCASVNKASVESDAEAKTFKPNPAVSQVYVYRNETFGAALSMPVTVNGKLLGATGPHSYFKFDLPAGTHTITSQGDTSKLDVTTVLGKIYYIWQEVKLGLISGGSKLQLVAEEVGKKGVLESSQIQANGDASNVVAPVAQVPAPMAAKPAVAAVPLAVSQPVIQAPVPASVAAAPAKVDPKLPDTSASNPINAIDQVPLSKQGKDEYREWLNRPLPRAFAVASNGVWLATWGTKPFNTALPSDPAQRALEACLNRAKMACQLYAVDNQLVMGR